MEGERRTPRPRACGEQKNPVWGLVHKRRSWAPVPTGRFPGHVARNPGAPVRNNNWRDPRQRRTFRPGVLFPLCCGGAHSSGSSLGRAVPIVVKRSLCTEHYPHAQSRCLSARRNVIQNGKFDPREQQRSSFMKLAIAGLLLAIGAGSAIAQTTSPGTSTAPDSAATGTAPGTAAPAERPRTQGNVPATTPGGPTASESSGPDPSKPRTSTSPDKSDPSPK